ncbi:quinone oxidoreductase [Clavulina sp. PMI_390]|nr:quinone oxidoreductase [Clavulina sp. PMI_390]
MDILQREGKYSIPAGASPILGVEFSGTVDSIGQGVTEFAVGTAVLGLTAGGAYAEYVKAFASHCIEKPEDMSWVIAAGIMENWITSYQALSFVSHFSQGETLLVHGGASGIGLAVAQLARKGGALINSSNYRAKVFATASSQEKVDFIKSVPSGATNVINYKTHDFVQEVLNETSGKGVDVVIDFIGQSYFARNMKALAVDGRMVILGYITGGEVPGGTSIAPILSKRLSIIGSTLRSRSPEYQSKLISEFKRTTFEHFAATQGRPTLEVFVHKVYNWNNIAMAHKEIEQNANSGKIILETQ